jgi:hypothetical protein
LWRYASLLTRIKPPGLSFQQTRERKVCRKSRERTRSMVQAYRTAGSRQEAVDSCCSVAVGRERWAGHGGEAILYFGGCIDLCHEWCTALSVWAYLYLYYKGPIKTILHTLENTFPAKESNHYVPNKLYPGIHHY